MNDAILNLHLNLVAGSDVEADLLDRYTRNVLRDIRLLEVETAHLEVPAESTPGTRGDPVNVGAIVVSLASAGVLTALLEVLKTWALRDENRKIKIRAQVEDAQIELEYSPHKTTEEELNKLLASLKGFLKE